METEKGVFIIRHNKNAKYPDYRLRIPTRRVLESWNFSRVILSSEAALAKYPITGKLGFREGTLLHNIEDGKMYLVSDSKRRHITSPDVFGMLGATTKDLVQVSLTEILLHAEGDALDWQSPHSGR